MKGRTSASEVPVEQGQARSAVYASFLVTLSNPGESERLVKSLSISANTIGNSPKSCNTTYRSIFVVGEQIDVTASRSANGSKHLEFATKVESFSLDQSGKEIPDSFVRGATGTVDYESCSQAATIWLQFEVSLPLPPKETTTFEIRFPQAFIVSKVVSQDADVVARGERFPISVSGWSSTSVVMTLDKDESLTICRDWNPTRPGDLTRC